MNLNQTSFWIDTLIPAESTTDTHTHTRRGEVTFRRIHLDGQVLYASVDLGRFDTGLRTQGTHLGLETGDTEYDVAVEFVTVATTDSVGRLDEALHHLGAQPQSLPARLQPGTLIDDVLDAGPRHGLVIMPFLWEAGVPRIVEEAHELGTQIGKVTLLPQLIFITDDERDLLNAQGLEALQQHIVASGRNLNDLNP